MDFVEYLCKLDIELGLSEEDSYKKVLYEECGFEKLEKLAQSENEEICTRAIEILDKYGDSSIMVNPESESMHILVETPKLQLPTGKTKNED